MATGNLATTQIQDYITIVDENDENKRTYKISKLSQEKKSFAEDILKKYNLTKEALQDRFGVKI